MEMCISPSVIPTKDRMALNVYKRSISQQGNMQFRLWLENDTAIVVLSEPNTERMWGIEKEIASDVYQGQFGTRRYVIRDKGQIIAGLLIGYKNEQWQLLMMHTKAEYRRQGLMRQLYNKAKKDVGNILPAAEFMPDGKAFWDHL
jgi:hypothetical protein